MREIPSNFRNSRQIWLTKALFLETGDLSEYFPKYTLATQDRVGQDGKVYPSLHRLYVDLADSSEYTFANTYLGGWSHWQNLSNCNFFRPYLNAMRDELEVKLRSQALSNIVQVAGDSSFKGFLDANKFLFKEAFVSSKDPKENSKRGRPSKQEIEKHIALEVSTNRRINDDLERITKN